MNKKEIVLPKMPYGEGTFSWLDKEHLRISFRKRINNKYEAVVGKTVQECMKKMREKEKILAKHIEQKKYLNPKNETLTLAQSALGWMRVYKSTELKGKSYDTLEGTFKNQIETAPFANDIYTTITSEEIQMYLNYLVNEKHYSISTVKKTKSFLDQYFKFIYKLDQYSNPMLSVKMPKPQNNIEIDSNGTILNAGEVYGFKEEYPVMSDEEMVRFIYAATIPLIEGIQGCKHGWGIVFLLWTFIRNGEALGLQWRDIDFENSTALVYKSFSRIIDRKHLEKTGKRKYKWALSTVKTPSSVRKFYLSAQAMEALNEYRKMQNPKSEYDFIFSTESGLPITNSNLNIMVKKILKKACIEKHITVHGLRHTGISYFLRHGMDKEIVARMAGHSDSKITEQVYYTILNEQEKEELDKVNRMVTGSDKYLIV